MKQKQRMPRRLSGQFALQPVELKVAQFTVRNAKNLTVEQQNLPLFAEENTLRRGDPRLLKRAVHGWLKVVIARQPDARCAEARDAFRKMLIGRGGLILRQIARCDNQIAAAVFGMNRA